MKYVYPKIRPVFVSHQSCFHSVQSTLSKFSDAILFKIALSLGSSKTPIICAISMWFISICILIKKAFGVNTSKTQWNHVNNQQERLWNQRHQMQHQSRIMLSNSIENNKCNKLSYCSWAVVLTIESMYMNTIND